MFFVSFTWYGKNANGFGNTLITEEPNIENIGEITQHLKDLIEEEHNLTGLSLVILSWQEIE